MSFEEKEDAKKKRLGIKAFLCRLFLDRNAGLVEYPVQVIRYGSVASRSSAAATLRWAEADDTHANEVCSFSDGQSTATVTLQI